MTANTPAIQTGAQAKLIYVAQRHPSYDNAGFIARWRQHAALGMSQTRWHNVARYLHCDTIKGPGLEIDTLNSEGVAIVIFRSEANRLAHIADEQARRTMKADELDTFAQPVAQTSLLVHEKIVVAAPAETFRLFVFWQSDAPDFSAQWDANGQRQAKKLKDLGAGLVQNAPMNNRHASGATPAGLACDGVDEITAADIQTLQAIARSWVNDSRLQTKADMVLTRTVVLHDKP